ncbi:hypothetical protein ASE14_06420 [Agromyces sp. Root81]|uniref:helix-turn-helix domain-containing protein n=1 Tax=Agromyces sp. Root81 TaxID=1736601 RepID=UPI0006FA707D|nr:helix-turn-helix domain-containing protein [Agromyces sp. Root81]KRC60621.1 hypothetical protein ASE14_06420 [Agromyces sp. Root81]
MAVTLDSLRKSAAATCTRRDIAEVMDVDPRTVTEGIKQGNIPSIKVGRRVLIPRERFLALFESEVA